MKVVGEARLRGSAESVWDALHDVVALFGAIPGCAEFEIVGPGQAQFVAAIALPVISGTYAAKVAVADQQPPESLRLTVAATGDQGTVAVEVTLRLSAAAQATTLVSYEASGTATGSIAGVGTRLLISAAKRLAAEFFAGLDDRAAAEPAPSPAAVAPAAAPAAKVPAREQPRAPVRPGLLTDRQVALVAGVAIGLAGVVVGVLAGRGRRGGRRVRA